MILDTVILTGFNLVALLVAVNLFESHTALLISFASLVGLFTVVGYHLLFEVAWDGQTPGKRQQKIRVVMADGATARRSALVIRNLLRVVDFLPGFYAVAIASSLLSARSQRLGDYAAGTIVVRLGAHAEPMVVDASGPLPAWADAIDVRGVGDHDYALARQWMARREQLDVRRQEHLATTIAGVLRSRVVGVPDGVPDFELVEVVVALVQRRSAGF